MKSTLALIAGFLLVSLAGCKTDDTTHLSIYSGRSESLVAPLIEQFEAETGITVDVRYGETAELATLLAEEGDQSQADLFWAQDGGALGFVEAEGLFDTLPDSILERVKPAFNSGSNAWVAVSGRARTLAYSPERVVEEDLPQSLLNLTDPQYKARIGWAPANGSFQAHVTALRHQIGEDSTRAWLEGVIANEPKAYPKNSAIVQAIADGEVDLGLPNHYYLYRFKSEDPEFPVEQTYFAAGDVGNLINVAGIGVLNNATHKETALRFLTFLLSDELQGHGVGENFEYAVVEGVSLATPLLSEETLDSLKGAVPLSELRDLDATLELLRDVGAL